MTAWKRLFLAAVAVPFCLMGLGLLMALAPAEMTPRSLQVPGAVAIAETAPGLATAFYLGDSLYVLLALFFFLCLYRLAAQETALARGLALIGIAAAFGKAAFDLAENLFFLQATAPVDPASAWLLSMGKRICGALCVLAFAPLYPTSAPFARIVQGLLLVTGIATLIGLWLPALMQANAMLLFFTAVAVAVSARRHAAY
ncbi:MAG: hypothetical protein AAFY02_17010 [Pseudomonadota bacterium]